MSDKERDPIDVRPGDGEVARWARIEKGVRQDAGRLARLVLDGQAESYEAKLLARRIDSVRTDGIGAEYRLEIAVRRRPVSAPRPRRSRHPSRMMPRASRETPRRARFHWARRLALAG